MLKIFLNNIEIAIVPESIQVQKDRDVFKDSLTVNYTDVPFLILENEQTIEALGVANRFTTQTQVYNVQVKDGFTLYTGRLYITNIIDGFREAELVYTNSLLDELETDIATYFDDVHISNGTPTTYEESTITDFSDSFWTSFVQDKLPRTFPEVDFNFPTISYPNKMADKEHWDAYKGEINAKNINQVYLNSKTTELVNQNVIVPYYYLLAPLYKAFKNTYGYTITGSFVNHETIQKTPMYHTNDLLVEITQPEDDETEWATVYKHHLTIEPSRFLPEWTLSEYLNNLKNEFNLDIAINQITKTITLNFAQESYKENPVDVSSFQFSKVLDSEPNKTTNYVLSDATGEDLVNVSLSEITNQVTELDTVTINTDFKQVPQTLTSEWEEKEGIGLLIYDYFVDDTYNIQELNNLNYSISAVNGIAANFWNNWLRGRIAAKPITTTLICSSYQKQVLEKAKSIYFAHQKFHIIATNSKSLDRNYQVELELITANR